jgi:hypothetical protein
MIFSYTAPATGPVTVSTDIATAGGVADSVPANNNASAVTAIGAVDVATRITGIPATAGPGATISGQVIFSNAGPQDALDVSYAFSIGTSGNTPTNVQFSGLPAGVGASYNTATGEVSLTGMPATLAAGDILSIGFSYAAPGNDGASIAITSVVSTSSEDAVSSNNNADVVTLVSSPPPPPPIDPSALPVPALPVPVLLLLVALLGGMGGSRLGRSRSRE